MVGELIVRRSGRRDDSGLDWDEFFKISFWVYILFLLLKGVIDMIKKGVDNYLESLF